MISQTCLTSPGWMPRPSKLVDGTLWADDAAPAALVPTVAAGTAAIPAVARIAAPVPARRRRSRRWRPLGGESPPARDRERTARLIIEVLSCVALKGGTHAVCCPATSPV